MGYAEKTKTSPREVLREMWCAVATQTVQRCSGGYGQIHEPEILLIALCKLARCSKQKLILSTSDIAEIHEGSLRALWRGEIPSCPPQERGLDGSSPRELGNALHSLPLGANAQQEGSEMFLLRGDVTQTWNVPETLSEMEKVWRSILDESAEAGDDKRLRTDTNIIIAAGCFPLSGPIPGRVGLLRGAGNAIVPQVAAEFVGAVIESIDDLK